MRSWRRSERTVRTEIEEHGDEMIGTDAIPGEYDFLTIETGDRYHAFQTVLIIERRGLDIQTMEIIPTDQFGRLIEDV